MYCDVMTMSFYFTKGFWYFIAICMSVSTHIFFHFLSDTRYDHEDKMLRKWTQQNPLVRCTTIEILSIHSSIGSKLVCMIGLVWFDGV